MAVSYFFHIFHHYIIEVWQYLRLAIFPEIIIGGEFLNSPRSDERQPHWTKNEDIEKYPHSKALIHEKSLKIQGERLPYDLRSLSYFTVFEFLINYLSQSQQIIIYLLKKANLKTDPGG
ncbi:hypothetical protein [Caproicibacter sp. BJN0012]|uniref:hypothetical protein n=1 Tax=Caproicibacter sp. BJN0012 TaxID=3110227 RepID=UPI002E158D54